MASSAVLSFSGTTFFWNDANQVGADGGAVFVNGGKTGGGIVDFNDGCVLEGNESARYGGGIYLGQGAFGTFDATQFLGNTSLLDGGAMFLKGGANSVLTDCLIAYNNSARRHAGGFYVGPQAGLDLTHCSIVGNFAPHLRSGLYLEPDATVDVTDSILWRNAGGSIESNGATVKITFCLNEDGANPGGNVLCCDPRYMGWDSLDEVYVDSSASGLQTGTPASPYKDLQSALMGFDFHLASDSPCIRSAGDGGNMGSNTGVGGAAGNITAALNIFSGTYDIRGRNIIFIDGIEGTDPNTSIIRHAVLGHIEDANIINLGITAEEIFGGITTRADVNFVDCNIVGNTSLADGGGLYVADGNCVMTHTFVSGNTSTANGGGVFLCPDVDLDATSSHVGQNTAAYGGGCFASKGTTISAAESDFNENTCTIYGGGLYLDASSVSSISSQSLVSNNTAHNNGGGLYLAGQLTISDSNIADNTSDGGHGGGGVYISGTGDLTVSSSAFTKNHASHVGGGVDCYGKMNVSHSPFESNTAGYGGAVCVTEEPSGPSNFQDCQFIKNTVGGSGGALYIWLNTAPVFVHCDFIGNKAYWGGAGFCQSARPTFEHCQFTSNQTFAAHGGSFFLRANNARFLDCDFINSSSALDAGVAWFDSDTSLFQRCYIEKPTAGGSGGAFCIDHSAPAFSHVQIVDGRAGRDGGGIVILGTSKPRFSDVTVRNCQAVYGGGVYAAKQSQSIFHQCDFRDNLALSSTTSADGGGVFFTEEASSWLTQCVFQGNSATDDGGGIAAAGSAKIDLRNTLLAFNTATNTGGGAYFTSTSTGTFTNCTIVSNGANGDNGGGGIYLDPNTSVNVDSSVICGNNPDGIRRQADPNVSYSCVQEAWPGPSNQLCGDGCTFDPNTFEPLDGSACIDAGNPDPNMNDGCQPPGKGTLTNDMGITGGPDNCAYASSSSSDPNLVGRWTFDRIVGIWTLDSSGRGQHALVNGPTSVPGRFEGALDFDGIDDYVEATIDVSEKTYAMSLWFTTTSKDGGIFSVIYGLHGVGGHDRLVYLRSGNLMARVWSNEAIGTTGVNYADGNWHCVVHTFGGEQKGQKLYVDGGLKASGSKSFSDFYWQTAVSIGHSPDASQPYYKGKLDEVRVYDRSLSPMDVLRLVNP